MINTLENSKAVASFLANEIFLATNIIDELVDVKEIADYLAKIDELYEIKKLLTHLHAIHHKIERDLGYK